MRPAQISAVSEPAKEMKYDSATSPSEYSGDSSWPATSGVMVVLSTAKTAPLASGNRWYRTVPGEFVMFVFKSKLVFYNSV
ncbi:hypothetical protein ACEN8K_23185 [Variovorax sp. CT11-76]